MKKSKKIKNVTFVFRCIVMVFVVVNMAVFLTGCTGTKVAALADAGLKRTETEYGWGVSGLVGQQLPDEKTTVYGLASYHNYSYTGGHDNLLQLGIQGRRSLGNEDKFWVAGEAAWVYDKSLNDYPEMEDPTAHGFSVGALAGYKLPCRVLDLSVFSGLAFFQFGDFKANGDVIYPKGNSVQLRVGLEVALPLFE